LKARLVLKAAILAAGAAGFVCALSAVASAKVVEPGSAYQPTTVGLAKMAVAASAPSTNPFTPATSAAPEIKKADPPVATPAPEPAVVRVQPRTSSNAPVDASTSPIERAVQPLRRGVLRFGSFLERVVSSCPVGPVSATGGPVIALAVLCFGLALDRRWVLAAQPTTDERVPEFLFTRELTPPG
jgi:hypothetical protein